MKTQNNKLSFNKNTMVELNERELSAVKGGSAASVIFAAIVVATATPIISRIV